MFLEVYQKHWDACGIRIISELKLSIYIWQVKNSEQQKDIKQLIN